MEPNSSEAGSDRIVLIFPIFNEEAVLPLLMEEVEAFRQLRSENISVLFIDDGSTDGSERLIRSLAESLSGYHIIRFSRNFGHQLAVTAGLRHVDGSVDAAIVLDADLQDPLAVAGDMINRWKEGADVVYGIRRTRSGMSATGSFFYRLYYRLFSRMAEIEAPLDAGDFRLLSAPVIRAYQQFEEQQPYVRGLVAWLGFTQVGIEYERPARAAGRSKYSLRKLFQLGFDGVTSFSGRPLRYAAKLGLVLAAFSGLGLCWALVEKLILQTNIPGWASLVFIGFFFGGLQLFFLGVVGAYVARVYEEVKGRPRYIIREMWSSQGSRVRNTMHGESISDASSMPSKTGL